MNPSNPEAFRAQFPAVIYESCLRRVVAHLGDEPSAGRAHFVVEGSIADAMGQPSWSARNVADSEVDGLLCEALEAFVAAQAEAATCMPAASVRVVPASEACKETVALPPMPGAGMRLVTVADFGHDFGFGAEGRRTELCRFCSVNRDDAATTRCKSMGAVASPEQIEEVVR